MKLLSMFLGIAVFDCCGKPHVVYHEKADTPAEGEKAFAERLAAIRPTMGEPKSTTFVEVPAFQFMTMESLYHDIPLPEPEVTVLQVGSIEELKHLIGMIESGVDPSTSTVDAPKPGSVH